MTVIFKSNSTASRSLGDISGLPDTNYSLLLDFNAQTYRKKAAGVPQRLSLSDAIVVTRANEAMYRKPDGTLAKAAPNTPRISLNSKYNQSGLLLETSRKNLIKNPYNPNGQTITINYSPAERYTLSVIGSGSAKLEGDNIEASTATEWATEGSPLEYSVLATTTVTVRTTGQVAWVGLTASVLAIGNSSLLPNPEGVDSMGGDTAKLTPTLFNEVIGGKKQFTIYMETIRNPTPFSKVGFRTNFFKLLDTTKSQTGIYIYRTTGSAPRINGSFIEGTSSVSAYTRILAAETDKVAVALSVDFDTKEFMLSQNSEVYESPYPAYAYNATFNELLLGSPSAFPSGDRLNGIVTKLAIYPKKMSIAELAALTRL